MADKLAIGKRDLKLLAKKRPAWLAFLGPVLIALTGFVFGTIVVFGTLGVSPVSLVEMFLGLGTPGPLFPPQQPPLPPFPTPPSSGPVLESLKIPPVNHLSNPRFWVWAFLTIAEFALWFVVGWPLWTRLLGERSSGAYQGRRVSAATIGLGIAFGLLFGLPGLASPRFWPPEAERIPGFLPRSVVMTIVGVLAALPPIATIWRVHDDAGRIIDVPPVDKNRLPEYFRFRSDVQDSLTVLGLLTVTATINIAAMRSAVNGPIAAYINAITVSSNSVVPKISTTDFRLIPSDAVLVYGLYFTLLLALIYVPIHVRLLRLGRAILDTEMPLKTSGVKEFKDSLAERKTMSDHMELKANPADSLRAAIAIASPFLVSIVGGFLGGS